MNRGKINRRAMLTDYFFKTTLSELPCDKTLKCVLQANAAGFDMLNLKKGITRSFSLQNYPRRQKKMHTVATCGKP